jgi:hypothetical protein
MCEAAQVGLGKNASVHSIHGSLLAVGELLRYLNFAITAFTPGAIAYIFGTFLLLSLQLLC